MVVPQLGRLGRTKQQILGRILGQGPSHRERKADQQLEVGVAQDQDQTRQHRIATDHTRLDPDPGQIPGPGLARSPPAVEAPPGALTVAPPGPGPGPSLLVPSPILASPHAAGAGHHQLNSREG